MKNIFYFMLGFILLGTPAAQAQNRLKMGQSLIKAGSSSAVKSAVRAGVNTPAALAAQAAKGIPAAAGKSVSQLRAIKGVNLPDLEAKISRQAAFKQAPQTNMRNFQALMPDQDGTRFSGTVFAIENNGKKEIYGVVATHVLAANDGTGNNVEKTFSAVFYDEGRPVAVPAEIVTVSAPTLLDVSLVKFPAEYENLLKPYTLGKMESESSLQTCGFNHDGALHMTSCEVQRNRPYSIHINVPLPREKRPGICGSAVLNKKQELVGIVVGSTIVPWVNPDRTFVAPSAYLYNLVEAYHNEGKSVVPFLLQGNHAINLNIDEYVTRVTLLDENKQPLYRYNIKDRFSRNEMDEAMQSFPETRFLEVTVQKIRWSEDGSTLLKKKDHNFPPVAYTFDLATDQIIASREVRVVLPF